MLPQIIIKLFLRLNYVYIYTCTICTCLQLSDAFDVAMAFEKYDAATLLVEDAGGLVSGWHACCNQ